MSTLLFSLLNPQQQAQAARIFQDVIFGTDPNDYSYEIEANGELVGHRCRVILFEKKVQLGKRSPLFITTSGQVQISNQAAHFLAGLILPDLLSDPVLATDPDLADLPVAGPSRNLPGWDQTGE
jgi:hypothetical protein